MQNTTETFPNVIGNSRKSIFNCVLHFENELNFTTQCYVYKLYRSIIEPYKEKIVLNFVMCFIVHPHQNILEVLEIVYNLCEMYDISFLFHYKYGAIFHNNIF